MTNELEELRNQMFQARRVIAVIAYADASGVLKVL